MEKEEYIIINKTKIQKRIEDLKESLAISESNQDKIRAGIERFEIKQLEWCLSQSTPLIPELEKVYDVGRSSFNSALSYEECKEDYYDYISNLKLDI